MGGGIIKMPEECGVGESKLGTGFTVYYTVLSIEAVSCPELL
jgi:hypothetical protein